MEDGKGRIDADDLIAASFVVETYLRRQGRPVGGSSRRKGLGEIAMVGVAPAIANAILHAAGGVSCANNHA
ncbi:MULTISPECIES: hypothetical protein [unclassified Mesorhizobium]|uniref:hypothetical protein n=1 Tax=unclassified Mesorhizobium TaxID=325217 RepID=UPI001927FF3B|nr:MULTISPECIES: hypothetical protein [unclassified Mesorhizobium]BCH15003.1 hypothetical protein MesoLjLa_18540 [Mesorhizobium sp. L-2-11]